MKDLKIKWKRVSIAFIACLTSLTSMAQINISVHISPPFRYRLQDYATYVSQVQIMITNTSAQTRRLNLLGSVSSDVGIEAHMKPGYKRKTPLVINPGEVKVFNGGDLSTLFDLTQMNYTGITQDQVTRQNGLPEGNYMLCISAYDYDTGATLSAGSPAGCSNTVSVTDVEPPVILSPADQGTVTAAIPQVFTITWSTPAGALPATQYRLRIAEVLGSRSPADAMASQTMPYFFDKTVMGNIYVYNPGDPQLTVGRRYAVMIQAIDPALSVNFRNSGQSVVTSFTCAAPSAAAVKTAKQISIFAEFAWFMRQTENGPYTGSYSSEGTRYGYYKARPVKLMAHKQTYNVTGRLDALYQVDPSQWRTALAGLKPVKGAAAEIEIATFTTTSDFGQVKDQVVDNPATAEYDRVAALLNTTNDKTVTAINTYDLYLTVTDPDFVLKTATPQYQILPGQAKQDFGGGNHLLANTIRFAPKLVDYRGAAIPLATAKVAFYKKMDYLKNIPAYINEGNVNYQDPSQPDAINDTTISGTKFRKISEMISANGTYFVPGIFYTDSTFDYLAVVKAPGCQTLLSNIRVQRPVGSPKSTPTVSQTFTLYPAWNAQNMVLNNTKINISATFKWIMRQSEITPYTGSFTTMNSSSSGYYNSRTVRLMAQRTTYQVTGHFDTLYKSLSNWSVNLPKLKSTKISTDTVLVASLGTQAALGMIDNAQTDNLASIEYNRVAALLSNINDQSVTTISTYKYYFSFNDPDFTPAKALSAVEITPDLAVYDFGGVNVLMANTFRLVPKLTFNKTTEIPLSDATVTVYKPLSFFSGNPVYAGEGTLAPRAIPTKADTTVNGVAYGKVSTMVNANGSYFVPGLFYTDGDDKYLIVVKAAQYQTVCTTLSFQRPLSIGTNAQTIIKTFNMVHSVPVFAGAVTRGGIAVANAVIWIAPTGNSKGGLTAAYTYRTQADASGKFSITLDKTVPGAAPVTFRVYDANNDIRPDGDHEASIIVNNYDFNNTKTPLNIQLTPLVIVQGHVSDTLGNTLIPYPYVHWKNSSQNLIDTSDPTDHSSFSVNVQPRTDTLVISAEGYNSRSIPMNIRANANFTSLQYRLRKITYTVTIHLQGENGSSLMSRTVSLVINNTDSVSVSTDIYGNAKFSNIPLNASIRYSSPTMGYYFGATGTSYITKSVTLNLALTRGLKLIVFLNDKATNAPITTGAIYANQANGANIVGTQYDKGRYSILLPANLPKPIMITAQADNYVSVTMQYDSVAWHDPFTGDQKKIFDLVNQNIIKSMMGIPVTISQMGSSSSSTNVYTISGSFVRIPKNNSFSIDPSVKLDFENMQVTVDSKGNAQPTTDQAVNITTQEVPITAFGYVPAILCRLNGQSLRVVDGQILGAVKVDYDRFPINMQLKLSGDLYLTSNPGNPGAASGIPVFASWDRIAGADSYFICGGEPSNPGSKPIGLSMAGFAGNIQYQSSRVDAQSFGFLASFDISGATNNTTPGESTLVLRVAVDKNGNSSVNNQADGLGGGIYLSGHNLRLQPTDVTVGASSFTINKGTLSVVDNATLSKSSISLNFSNLSISPNNISGASFAVATTGSTASKINIYGAANFETQDMGWKFGKNSVGNYYISNPNGVLSATSKGLKIDVSDFVIQTNGTSAHAVSYNVNQDNVVIHYAKLADFVASAVNFDNSNQQIIIPGQFQINLIPVAMKPCTLSFTGSLTPDTVRMPGNSFNMMGDMVNVDLDWKFVSTADSVYFLGDGLLKLKDKLNVGAHFLLVGLPDRSAPRFFGNIKDNTQSSKSSPCNGCIVLGSSGYVLYNYYGSFRYANSDDWNLHLLGDITDLRKATHTITHTDLTFNSADILTGTSNTKFYDPAMQFVYENIDGKIVIDFKNQIASVQVESQRDLIPSITRSGSFGQLNFYLNESSITGFARTSMSNSLINLSSGNSEGQFLLGINANLAIHKDDYFGYHTYLTAPDFGATYLVNNGIFNGLLLTAVNTAQKNIGVNIDYFGGVGLDNVLNTYAFLSGSFTSKIIKVTMIYNDKVSGFVKVGALPLNFGTTISSTATGSFALDDPASINYLGTAGFQISACAGFCNGGCSNGAGTARTIDCGLFEIPDPFSAYLKICIGKTLSVNCGTSGQPTLSIN